MAKANISRTEQDLLLLDELYSGICYKCNGKFKPKFLQISHNIHNSEKHYYCPRCYEEVHETYVKHNKKRVRRYGKLPK